MATEIAVVLARLRGRGRAVFLLPLLALVMSDAGGCYDPQIKSGQLTCAPGGLCPGGFVCNSPDNKCVAAEGGGTGTGGGSGTGGAGGTCAIPLAPLCSPSASAASCDPVCQAGCGCGLECAFTGTAFACVRVPAAPKKEGEVCAPTVDDCAPGFICLADTCGTSLRRCHRSCTDTSNPCTGVCNQPPTGSPANVKGCTLPAQACDPYGALGNNGCPDPALYCFTDGIGTTFCDCLAAPAAQKPEGAPCALAAECGPGLACLSAAGQTACYRLCKPGSTNICAGCTSLGRVGYCP